MSICSQKTAERLSKAGFCNVRKNVPEEHRRRPQALNYRKTCLTIGFGGIPLTLHRRAQRRVWTTTGDGVYFQLEWCTDGALEMQSGRIKGLLCLNLGKS